MSAQIINGRALAAQIYAELDERVKVLKSKGVTPRVALVLVGYNEMSTRYVSLKQAAATSHSMECIVYHLAEETPQEKLVELIHNLNDDELIHGIMVQMPLPEHMDTTEVLDEIAPTKDIDGLHFCNTGKLLNSLPSIVACTPRAIMRRARVLAHRSRRQKHACRQTYRDMPAQQQCDRLGMSLSHKEPRRNHPHSRCTYRCRRKCRSD